MSSEGASGKSPFKSYGGSPSEGAQPSARLSEEICLSEALGGSEVPGSFPDFPRNSISDLPSRTSPVVSPFRWEAWHPLVAHKMCCFEGHFWRLFQSETREGGGCPKFSSGQVFRRTLTAPETFLPDFAGSRKASPTKVWAFSGMREIGLKFGNAAGFSLWRPPQPSWVLLIQCNLDEGKNERNLARLRMTSDGSDKAASGFPSSPSPKDLGTPTPADTPSF